MILFYEDWKKYPEAIVHIDTKNESWLRTALLFKKMGIRNHAFLLALHNPKLKNIDPWDSNLSEIEIAMIIKECIENPWYVFREILRIPTLAGPVPFKANRANISTIWNYFNHITTYLIQPRQTGKSITIESILAVVEDVLTENNIAGLLTKDEKLRGKTSEQTKGILEAFPPYLRYITRADVKNNERITIKKRKNEIQFFVPGISESSALGKGRGLSMSTTVIDEFAFIKYVDITIPAFLTASTAVREQAKEHGIPYGTIFTTTPGKLNTREGRYAYKVYQKSLRWSEKFFDLENREELLNVLRKNSSENGMEVMLLEYNHRQLGYTDEWLKERIKTALMDDDPEAVEAELLNKWTGGSHKSPISKETREILEESVIHDFIPITGTEGYVLRQYVPNSTLERMRNEGFIVIGLDTSDAVGKDDIGLVARYSKTGEVVYVGDFNETNTAIFANFLAEHLIRNKNTILVPERRSTGSAIIDNLIKILVGYDINPFKVIFNRIYQEPEKYSKVLPEFIRNTPPDMSLINKYRQTLGFATSSSGLTSRSSLYGNIFNSSLKYTAKYTRDKKLVDELLGLTIKNGRIDHDEDGHDDLVIAWLLAYWFLLKGENKKYYNVGDTYTLTNIMDNLLEKQNISKDDVAKQQLLKNKINALLRELKNTNNEVLALRILAQIRRLESGIDKRIITNFDIDTILEEIKILKKIKHLHGKKTVRELLTS